MMDLTAIDGASQRLASWVVAVPRSWTQQGFDAARWAVHDSLLCAISGAGDLQPVLDALDPGSGPCPVPGSSRMRVLPDAAALAWGTAIHKRELDDQTYSMGGHLMCTVLAALLCTQYRRTVTWPQLFDAVVVACDVASRINRCMTRKHMEQGWVATTTYGLVAATCAIARIEKFSVDQTLAAISLACNKAFGNKNLFGTPAKPVNPGLAARDAVLLARLARHGLVASTDPLEGNYGFGQMYRGEVEPDWSVLFAADESTTPFINTGMAFKKHPCCASSHRCVDALLELRATHGFSVAEVSKITALVGPLNHLTLRYHDPENAPQAMFSMQYILASALRFGALSPADFSSDAIQDPLTRSLFPRIDMQVLPEARAEGFVETTPLAHSVQVQLVDGTVLEKTILHPKGAPQNPFTPEDWELKFQQCTKGLISDAQVRDVRHALERLDALPMSEVMDVVACFDSPYDPDGRRFQR